MPHCTHISPLVNSVPFVYGGMHSYWCIVLSRAFLSHPLLDVASRPQTTHYRYPIIHHPLSTIHHILVAPSPLGFVQLGWLSLHVTSAFRCASSLACLPPCCARVGVPTHHHNVHYHHHYNDYVGSNSHIYPMPLPAARPPPSPTPTTPTPLPRRQHHAIEHIEISHYFTLHLIRRSLNNNIASLFLQRSMQ